MLRTVREADRERFVELFADDSFMVFSESGALDRAAGALRFDRMLALGQRFPFCRRAVVETESRCVVGFVGADFIDYRGAQHLEFGFRLVAAVRGRGYGAEAARPMLDLTTRCYPGHVLAFVDPSNDPSRKLIAKLGFTYVETIPSSGQWSEVHWLHRPHRRPP